MMSPRWIAFVLACAALTATVGCGGSTKAPKPSDPNESIERLDTPGKIRVAQSYFQNGRAAQALDIMNAAIAADPQNAGARNYLGQLLLLMGRAADAEPVLVEALRLDPYLTDAHNNLGAVFAELGDPARAEKEFRLALADRTYPTPERAYLNLGRLYESQGRRDEAIAMLRRSVEANTSFHAGHYELAGLLEQEGKLREAAELYEVAAPSYRASASYHLRLGITYFRLDDPIRARQHFNEVREIAPGSEAAAKAAEYLALME